MSAVLPAPLVTVHYTGHRISSPGALTAFAANSEAAVVTAIDAVLDTLDIAWAFGSLASGADTLFAEAFLARAIPVTIIFPFSIDRFKEVSVRAAGGDWESRFDHIIARCNRVSVLAAGGGEEDALAACGQTAMRDTRIAAAQFHAQAIQLACWDGRTTDRPAGTAADVAAWRAAGLTTILINPFTPGP